MRGFAGEDKADEAFASQTEFRATAHGNAMPKAMLGECLEGHTGLTPNEHVKGIVRPLPVRAGHRIDSLNRLNA